MHNNESTPPSGKLLTSFIQNRTFQTCFLIYSSALIFLGRQLDLGLQNFDDTWYAQKAKEIFLHGNPFIVTYNGVPEFAESPLYFWMSGLSFKIFGVSGYGAVFPSAVLGAATIYLTYRLSLALFNNQWTAFLAAIVLLFPGMFTDSARRGMVDISLAFFVTAAMFSFYKAQEDKRFYLLFGLMTALGVLTKSMLGFFPLIIAGVLLIVYGKVKELWNGYFLAGAVLALGLGTSWYWINYLEFGDEFIAIHFGVHLLKRGFTQFTDPLYFLGYCKDLLKTYWPWLPFFLWGLVLFGRKAFREKDFDAGFVLAWFAIIFLTMSASKNQTLRYLFMMFPAMALVTSETIAGLLTEKWRLAVVALFDGQCLGDHSHGQRFACGGGCFPFPQ